MGVFWLSRMVRLVMLCWLLYRISNWCWCMFSGVWWVCSVVWVSLVLCGCMEGIVRLVYVEFE